MILVLFSYIAGTFDDTEVTLYYLSIMVIVIILLYIYTLTYIHTTVTQPATVRIGTEIKDHSQIKRNVREKKLKFGTEITYIPSWSS